MLQLRGIAGMLVVAASAAPEVAAVRLDALRGGRLYGEQLRAQQARLGLRRADTDHLAGQNPRHKHSFSVDPAEAFSSVNPLLDRQFDGRPVCVQVCFALLHHLRLNLTFYQA